MEAKLKAVPKDRGTAKTDPTEGTDFEPSCQIDVPPLIPAGEYEVTFHGAEEKRLWGKNRLFLHFRVAQQGEYLGQALFMAVTMPTNGSFSISSKYLAQWSLAAGNRPARRDRLSTKVFRGKLFLARVRTVKNGHDGKERSASWHYSVIDSLLEVRAGR